MRQHVWSADVYCRNLHNWKHTQSSYLYGMDRRDECANKRREREGKSTRVWGLLYFGVASVVKTAVGNTDNFGISQDTFTLIYFNCKKVCILMAKIVYQDYKNIFRTLGDIWYNDISIFPINRKMILCAIPVARNNICWKWEKERKERDWVWLRKGCGVIHKPDRWSSFSGLRKG
jgi:hypothetical protein